MIRKYTIGDVLETGAVVLPMEECVGEIPYLIKESENTYTYHIEEKDVIYGLGKQSEELISGAGNMSLFAVMIRIMWKMSVHFMEHIISSLWMEKKSLAYLSMRPK